MKQITVSTPSRNYAALVERGLARKIAHALATLPQATGIFVLSSPKVWKHCGRVIGAGMQSYGNIRPILFNDAERAKSIGTVEKICRHLVRAGADRDALILAVGGGVVGDVGGFVAASYLRGVRLVHIPTTLVAQVDSAIGGKAGVNLPEGKNLVGAFYQPSLVMVDPDLLGTLPQRQFRSGLYEVIKYGILNDKELFAYLEQNLRAIAKQEPRHLDFVIERCIEAKARIVSEDERESGKREALNLGHTFAHAIETGTGYRKFLHGETVGWGLICAARLSTRLGALDNSEAQRIAELVKRVGPLPKWLALRSEKLVSLMQADKKTRGGKVRFVLPRTVGSVETGVEVPEGMVIQVLRDVARGGSAK